MATKKKTAAKKPTAATVFSTQSPAKRGYKRKPLFEGKSSVTNVKSPDGAVLTFQSHGQEKELRLPLDLEDLREVLKIHDAQVTARSTTANLGTIAMDGKPDPDKKMGTTFSSLVGIAGEINNIIQTVNGITVLANKLSGNESKPVEFVEPMGDNNLIGNLNHIGSKLSNLGNHLYEVQDSLRTNL